MLNARRCGINDAVPRPLKVHLIQRGGSPNAYDRVLSTQFGVHAAELIRDGVYGVTVALKGNEITHNKLSDIAGVPKLVPPDNTMITTARNIGISFGD